MAATIGGKEVIFNQTFLVPQGEETIITASQGDDVMTLSFVLEDSPKLEEKTQTKIEPSVKVEGMGDRAKITLLDWHRPFGMMTSPMRIGNMDNGQVIWLMVDCVRMPKAAKLVVQVMLEAQHGKA